MKIWFIHPSVYKDKRMSAEITVSIGCAQMFSSRILACRIGQLLYDEAILEKGSLKSFICFISYLMFYFFLKRIIYCPWSTKLYLQTFICQIKAVATQMDISWHTMAYPYHRRTLPSTEFMEDYWKYNRE